MIFMITIILHNAALELINEKICNIKHKAIVNDANRRNKSFNQIILDISVHQSAIYPEKMINSGRPDLVHMFALQYHHIVNLLPEEIKSKVRLFIHTKNNEYFQVQNSWRVPVHFIRFRGLMEKFLVQKRIKFDKQEEMVLFSGTLKDLIYFIKPKLVIQFLDTGVYENNSLTKIKESILAEDETVFLIGGYQKGEVEADESISIPLKKIKLVDKPTTAWMVLNILLTGLITDI